MNNDTLAICARVLVLLLCSASVCHAKEKQGAQITWTTVEAEDMRTTGTIMGPAYNPYMVETESSGQKCVKLNATGQFVECSAPVTANSLVIRYSLPDGGLGNGTSTTLGIYKNGNLLLHKTVTSHYAYLYGKYPFTNNPADGETRNFYDETSITGIAIEKGDVIKVQRDDATTDNAGYCIIDMVDLEKIPDALTAPANALSITDKSFAGSEPVDDYTEAFRKCIAAAAAAGKTVWIPAGTYKITGDIVLPANITVRGAGMWYSVLAGDENLYHDANRRVRIKGDGSNIHISGFAIAGKLNYRNDNEPNDGIVGQFEENSTISGIWIEHTKVGMWIQNSHNLTITGCRMRNTIADGINFCVGMSHCTIENCTARGTGDDCFAFWPAVFEKQRYSPGHNLVSHCTGQLPFLANGAAIYGGESNSIANCSFTDISQGSAVLISTTFPTENDSVHNNFSGITVVKDCNINTSGGFDHEWDWRAAVEVCLDRRSIAGLAITGLNIKNSLSNAVSIIGKTDKGKTGTLSGAVLSDVRISNYGIGTKDKYGLYVSGNAIGTLVVKDCVIPEYKNDSGGFVISK